MSDWTGLVYTTAGAAAGAVTALFIRPMKNMTAVQAAGALFVGFSFSFFVSPLLFHNIADQKIAGGIFYLMATGSNAFIPIAIKWFSNFLPGKAEQ